MDTIALIDYGMGNLHSAAKALAKVAPEAQVAIVDDPALLSRADRIVFPGVGAIRDCMAEIHRLGFDQAVPEAIAAGKPVLGICVGMQALMTWSAENDGVDGLDVLPGQVRFFGHDLREQHNGANDPLKVPHMGWNQVRQCADAQGQPHPLWSGIDQDSRFYFVHSYYVRCEQRDRVAGVCHYGLDFDAALARDNLFAVQFHPEKSSDAGLQLLANFARWNP